MVVKAWLAGDYNVRPRTLKMAGGRSAMLAIKRITETRSRKKKCYIHVNIYSK